MLGPDGTPQKARGSRFWTRPGVRVRPSGPDETGEFLAMNGVKRELEQLLNNDFDDKAGYGSEEEEVADDLDDVGTLYSPSNNHKDDEDMNQDHDGNEDDFPEGDRDRDGDVVFEEPAGETENDLKNLTDKQEGEKRGWPASRMKRKTPPEDVDCGKGLRTTTSSPIA